VLLSVSINSALAQTENYVSTGYCMFRQGSWEKEWTTSSDAGFIINRDSGEIRFDHTTWASHSLKINRTENSQTEEGIPLIVYHCTEPANGDQWEVRFNEWTLFDEAGYYHYYQIELKSPSALIKFMTRKAG
jgi:hypothetical protein